VLSGMDGRQTTGRHLHGNGISGGRAARGRFSRQPPHRRFSAVAIRIPTGWPL